MGFFLLLPFADSVAFFIHVMRFPGLTALLAVARRQGFLLFVFFCPDPFEQLKRDFTPRLIVSGNHPLMNKLGCHSKETCQFRFPTVTFFAY